MTSFVALLRSASFLVYVRVYHTSRLPRGSREYGSAEANRIDSSRSIPLGNVLYARGSTIPAILVP